MKWQPIDTVPKDGTYILLYDDGYQHSAHSYLIGRFWLGVWWGVSTSSGKSRIWISATHWMPLPEKPE